MSSALRNRTLLAAVLLSSPCIAKAGWLEHRIHAFDDTHGGGPEAGVTFDSAGDLYGTTIYGGAHGLGTVYQLTPPIDGRREWRQKVLLSFHDAAGHYAYPGALIVDSKGNLYGTTEEEGKTNQGLVYMLTPPANGKNHWHETILHQFNGTDGAEPIAGLTFDAAGNLYGTTFQGGNNSVGTVFELSPPANGKTHWTETILHTFVGPEDGGNPAGGVIFDPAGNLYGTAYGGGPRDEGAVFMLEPPAAGKKLWHDKVLLTFTGQDGAYPLGAPALDNAGNLYIMTSGLGRHDDGTVIELSPPKSGKDPWRETVLHSFGGPYGESPNGPLTMDSAGALYGLVHAGGPHGDGFVVKLTPPAEGQTAWITKKIHAFEGFNGAMPSGGLTWDTTGHLYGATYAGGEHNNGIVFELEQTR